jgi:hypothetical protein
VMPYTKDRSEATHAPDQKEVLPLGDRGAAKLETETVSSRITLNDALSARWNVLVWEGRSWHTHTYGHDAARALVRSGITVGHRPDGVRTLHSSAPPPCASVTPTNSPPAEDAGVVQSLQRQTKEREKRIAELESQLEVLKVIDQDVEKRRQSSRPPATVTPTE